MNTIRVAALAALLLAGALAPSPSYATVFVYDVILDGPSESPANASPGTGIGQVDWDDVALTMRVQVTFSGLTGNTTASHIHAATVNPNAGNAGVATTTPTFAGFPLGVTAGAYDNTLDLTLASSYNPTYVTNNGGSPATAMAALKLAIDAEKSYLNIHSSTFPGGEIRGFLHLVPEPSTWALLTIGAAGIGLIGRRRRS